MDPICIYCAYEKTDSCKQCQRNGYGNQDNFVRKCCGNCNSFFKKHLCTLNHDYWLEPTDYCSFGWELKDKKK